MTYRELQPQIDEALENSARLVAADPDSPEAAAAVKRSAELVKQGEVCLREMCQRPISQRSRDLILGVLNRESK